MPSPRRPPPSTPLQAGLVLLGVAQMLAALLPDCGGGEWRCGEERCISLNKFCDGIENCEDGSDEPLGCTNCNRTFYGEANVKYPLRVTGPFQRYLPFVCKITFVAAGKEFGDFVELTFLSFQIGRLELTSYPYLHKRTKVKDTPSSFLLDAHRKKNPSRKQSYSIDAGIFVCLPCSFSCTLPISFLISSGTNGLPSHPEVSNYFFSLVSEFPRICFLSGMRLVVAETMYHELLFQSEGDNIQSLLLTGFGERGFRFLMKLWTRKVLHIVEYK
ncbi:uncharacterized protein CDAR_583391 [Caerostris darwini]|uniref:CUB domain-containing protein n=1 Tax=Caerostris darwini TaxID=1538125 RepID=A0AAV4V9K6_9ARAC|nr:uncharacterized protein CDAR_583391 [Caerostris darwini]